LKINRITDYKVATVTRPFLYDQVGDQIMEINGISTKGMSHTEAIDLIKRDATVKLLMRRRRGASSSSTGPLVTPLLTSGPHNHPVGQFCADQPRLPVFRARRDSSLDSARNRYSNPPPDYQTTLKQGYCSRRNYSNPNEEDIWVKRASRRKKRVLFASHAMFVGDKQHGTTMSRSKPGYCRNDDNTDYCNGNNLGVFKGTRSKSTLRF